MTLKIKNENEENKKYKKIRIKTIKKKRKVFFKAAGLISFSDMGWV